MSALHKTKARIAELEEYEQKYLDMTHRVAELEQENERLREDARIQHEAWEQATEQLGEAIDENKQLRDEVGKLAHLGTELRDDNERLRAKLEHLRRHLDDSLRT